MSTKQDVFFCAVPYKPPLSGVLHHIRDLRVLRFPVYYDKDGLHFGYPWFVLIFMSCFFDFLGHCAPNILAEKYQIMPFSFDAGLCYFWDTPIPEKKPLDLWVREWFSVAPIEYFFMCSILSSLMPHLLMFLIFQISFMYLKKCFWESIGGFRQAMGCFGEGCFLVHSWVSVTQDRSNHNRRTWATD